MIVLADNKLATYITYFEIVLSRQTLFVRFFHNLNCLLRQMKTYFAVINFFVIGLILLLVFRLWIIYLYIGLPR